MSSFVLLNRLVIVYEMLVAIVVFILLVTPLSVYSICDVEEPIKIEYQDDICLQTKLVGSCKLKIKRFYFNVKAQQCEKFFYEGCKGNRNNFKTEGKIFHNYSHASSFLFWHFFFTSTADCVCKCVRENRQAGSKEVR